MAVRPFGSAHPVCLASWERNLEANLTKEFSRTRDCQGSRGFSVFNPNPGKKKRHEQNKQIAG
jgi:hypothetical protein